jgi:alpha-tubulin suppressor-like RCC1 family protein
MHGLILEPDGTVQAWRPKPGTEPALDALGLGHNDPFAGYTLTRIPGLSGVTSVVAGTACSFAVLADGTVMACGLNAGSGLLGTTPLAFFETRASWSPDSNRPIPVPLDDVVEVSSQESHVLALTREGRVFAWGRGEDGQLGIGPMPVIRYRTQTPSAPRYVPFPLPIPTLVDVAAISAGPRHSLALMKDGTVRAWGFNRWGQVGDGTTVNRATPVVVTGVRDAVAVAAGRDFSLALLNDGSVMAWGNQFEGATGRTVAADNLAGPTPMPVPGARAVKAIAAGSSHALALTEAGTIISWGQSDFGALGRGLNASSAAAPLRSPTGVQSLAAHGSTSIAVLANGRIMTWGSVRPWTRPPEEARTTTSATCRSSSGSTGSSIPRRAHAVTRESAAYENRPAACSSCARAASVEPTASIVFNVSIARIITSVRTV